MEVIFWIMMICLTLMFIIGAICNNIINNKSKRHSQRRNRKIIDSYYNNGRRGKI